MTNTLHRYGTAESFFDDYVVIAIPSKGNQNGGDPMPALRRFLEIALDYEPASLGDAMAGGAYRPTEHGSMWDHFFMERPTAPDLEKVLTTLTKPTTYADPTYLVDGVTHFAVTNMPGAVPQTSSQAICAAILPYVQRLASDKQWRKFAPLASGINVENGKLVHPALKGMKLS